MKDNVTLELIGGPLNGKKWKNLLTEKIASAIIGGYVPKENNKNFINTYFSLLQNEKYVKMTYRVTKRLPNKIILEWIGE